jgi:hypothetical protein
MKLEPRVEPAAETEAAPVDNIKRRGLFAAVAGLVAAIMMKPKEVAATSGGGAGGPLVIGSTFLSPNTGDMVTVLTPGAGNYPHAILAEVIASVGGGTATNVNAFLGQGRGTGSGLIGVTGFSVGNGGNHATDLENSGVVGYGNASSVGVFGVSGTRIGVLGSGPSATGTGVYGLSANNGVVGLCHGTTGIGVLGQTSGTSAYGVYGRATAGGVGVFGDGNPWAGVFSGGVYINGALTVTGAKSATVSHPDGSLRRLYCVESPESWFEDFGKGKLVDGTACVTLDPDFVSVVNNDDYHVFLTPNGNSKGLYVEGQTPGTFEVREQEGGTSNLAFNYRVVARRKDIAGPRFEKVDAPDFAAASRLTPVEVPQRPKENDLSPEVGRT